jgi:phosphoglycerol transferase
MGIIRTFLNLLSIFIIYIKYWLTETFGKKLSIDNIIFHILGGTDNVVGTDVSVFLSFIKINVILLVLVILVIPNLPYFKKRDLSIQKNINTNFKLIDKFVLALRKDNFGFNNIFLKKYTTPFLLLFSIIYFAYGLEVVPFVQTFIGEDFFSNAYVNPKTIKFDEPAKKKNLIILYVESLEQGLRNKKIHGVNLVESIDNIKGVTIPNFVPAPGTRWSMAGMLSSQCSFPLKPYYGGYHDLPRIFFPNAICLGDILARFGYKQYFLSGPDIKFDGMDRFYNHHGYQQTIGKNEWRKRGLSPKLFTSWGAGPHDDTLLEEAKKIIQQNHSANQAYNLTLITTDTHAPKGFPSPRCLEQEKLSGFRGTYKCTSRFISNFINDLKKENLLNNTVVVIMGDHPFMENPFQSHLFPDPRYVYIKFIYDDYSKPSRDKMTHFDVAPSILDLLGIVNSSHSRFGLGVSLFSKVDTKKHNDHFELVTSNKILNHSLTYDSFWLSKSNTTYTSDSK